MLSYARGMPVSVILTEGDRRDRQELGEGSSHVQFRSLDPIKWYVHEYADESGDALLVRGLKPAGVMQDSGDAESEEMGPPDDVQQRAIKIRRGQSKFREKLLAAYGFGSSSLVWEIKLAAAQSYFSAEEPSVGSE